MQPSKTMHLWGFDGQFGGNEDRVHSCLPVFTVGDDGTPVVARAARWSPDVAATVQRFSDEAEAANMTTSLPLKLRSLEVQSGQVLAVAGPTIVRSVKRLQQPGTLDLRRWEAGPDHFLLRLVAPDAFARDIRLFASGMESLFDAEIRAARGSCVSERAKDALTVLRGLSYGRRDSVAVRGLVAARIKRSPDEYRSLLQLSSTGLGVSPSQLEESARRHLELVVETTPFGIRVEPQKYLGGLLGLWTQPPPTGPFGKPWIADSFQEAGEGKYAVGSEVTAQSGGGATSGFETKVAGLGAYQSLDALIESGGTTKVAKG